jgi:hypothetical protein
MYVPFIARGANACLRSLAAGLFIFDMKESILAAGMHACMRILYEYIINLERNCAAAAAGVYTDTP